ncbi:MAG: hypothetical protein K6E29_04645 [Cyanobacteria bacterium RUI128]|nr:hypothetical protein [Cyanobacteria bacterium RUI128]
MVSGLVSQALSNDILARAKKTLSENQPALKPAQDNATKATSNINSVFSEAETKIKAAIENQVGIQGEVEGQINAQKDIAIAAGQANADLQTLIQQAVENMQKLQEDTDTKLKEQADIKLQIEELGGQVDDEATSINDGGSDETYEVPPGGSESTDVGRTNRSTTTTTNPIKKTSKKGNGSKLDEIQERYKQLGIEIGENYKQIEAIRVGGDGQDGLTKMQETFSENVTTMNNAQSQMNTDASNGKARLQTEDSTIANQKNIADQKISQERTAETKAQERNVTKSINLDIKGSLYEMEARTLDSNDSNKEQILDTAREIKELGKDFGIQRGVAKTNTSNVMLAGQKLSDIASAASANKYTELNEAINNLLNNAISEISQYNAESPGTTSVSSQSSVNTNIGGGAASAIAGGVTNLLGNVDFGDSAGGEIAKTLISTAGSLVGGFF